MANYDITRFRRGRNTRLGTQERGPDDPARDISRPKRPVSRGTIANIVVMAFAGGLVATLAIPAYAFAPGATEPRNSAATELTRTSAQAVEVPTQANIITVARDGFTATTPEVLAARAAAKTAAAAAAAEAARASAATSSAASTGSAVAVSAPIRTFPVTSVFAVAARFQGVPYVFGGASPRGFDCSGLVKYVWAKFGKTLPHSSNAQAAAGRRIPRSAARPGDLVVLPGHIGFYAGNGKILHAPYPGQRVRIQPIWTSNYYIVRL